MKFKLGQLVKYKTKDLQLMGIVVAIDKSYDYGYIIDPIEINRTDHWKNYRKEILADQPCLSEYFDQSTTWGTRRTKKPCVAVGVQSRLLTPAEVQYDPNQMVDEEDDL